MSNDGDEEEDDNKFSWSKRFVAKEVVMNETRDNL